MQFNIFSHNQISAKAASTAMLSRQKGRLCFPCALLSGLVLVKAFRFWQPHFTVEDRVIAPELIKSAIIDKILMRWEEHGSTSNEKIPIVLIHGLPTHPRVWRYVIPQIVSDSTYCLAWEQVGFGWSLAQGLGRDISIPKQAQYLYSWLKHLGISKAVFAAHDYGGGVLQRFLIEHQDMCMGLVFTDVVSYDNWPVAAVRAARSISWLFQYLTPELIKPFFMTALLNLGHDNRNRGAESAILHWQPYNSPVGPKAFTHQLRHFHSRDTLSLAHQLPQLKLDIPVRVVWGERDPLGMASAEQLAKDFNAQLISIPGGRHFTPEDHPGVIADAINSVIMEVAKS